MAVKVKRRRRLMIVLLVGLGVVVVVGGGLWYRIQQIRATARQSRVDGMAAFEQGDYYNAMHRLGVYLHQYPDDTEAMYSYAQARLHNPEPQGKHIMQAIGVLRRVVDGDPEHPTAQMDLLDLYVAAGYRTEAVAIAEKILEQEPGHQRAVHAKFIALMGMREYDRAMTFADDLLKPNPAGEPTHTSKVRGHALRSKVFILNNQGKFQEALEYSNRYNELAPEDIEGQYRTMQLMARLGSPSEQYILRAQQLQADQGEGPRYVLLEAMAYRLSGDRAQAIRLLREVGQAGTPDEWLLRRLVGEMDNLGLYSEATEALASASSQVNLRWLQRVLVHRLVQAGMRDRVLAFMDQAAVDPAAPDSDSELLGLHAMVLLEVGRYPEAGIIIEALGTRTQDPIAEGWVPFLRDVKAQSEPDVGEVVVICRNSIAASPNNPYFHFVLGQAYMSLGERDLALNAWGKAAEYGPAWAVPRLQMAKALIGTERAIQAVALAESAFRRAPRHPEVAITLAQVVAMNLDRLPDDRLDRLMELVERIQGFMPDDRRAREIQILVLARRGQQDEARAVLRKILDTQDPPLTEQDLIRLSQLSRKMGLGLEQLCLVKAEKLNGLTPALALQRAMDLLAQGQADQGLEVIQSVEHDQKTGNEVAWAAVLAKFLDAKGDASAAAVAWAQLGDQNAENVGVQKAIISSGSAWGDLGLIDRTIERLRSSTREEAISWRVARARWLMTKANGESRELAKAVRMLMDVVTEAPALVEPKLILARCYGLLKNHSGAIEQLSRAAEIRPKDHNIKLDMARVYQSQGNFDGVRAVVGQIADSDEKKIEHVEYGAQLLVRQGDVDLGLALLERVYDPEGRARNSDLLLARIYQQKNRIEQAEQVVQKLMVDPTVASIRFAADFYASQGRADEAENTLALLEQIPLAPGMGPVIRGEYLARYAGPERAVIEFEAAVKSAPTNARIWRELIRMRITLGQADQAIVGAQRAMEAVDDDAVFQWFVDHEGLVIASMGDRQRVELVQGLLGDEPTRVAAVEALRIVADAAGDPGSTEDAVLKLRRLTDANTQYLALQNYMTGLLTRLGRYEEAIVVGTRAMGSFPTNPKPARLSAYALSATGRWSEVVGVATQWRERVGGQVRDADRMIAEAKLNMNDPGGALEHIRPYIREEGANPGVFDQVYVNYARALIMQGHYDQADQVLGPLLGEVPWRVAWVRMAVTEVRKASVAEDWLSRVPGYLESEAYDEWILLARGWEAMSTRYGRKEFHGQAKAIIEDVVSRPTAPAECWLLHGVFAYVEGEVEKAEASYRRALEIQPDLHAAKNNLAMVLADRGVELDEALRVARDAVAVGSTIPAYYDTLAAVHVARGEYELAIEQLERSVDLEPGNPTWKANLAKVLAEAGRTEEAKMLNNSGPE